MLFFSICFTLLLPALIITTNACDSSLSPSDCYVTGSCPSSNCYVNCQQLGWTQLPCASILPSPLHSLDLSFNKLSKLPNNILNGTVNFSDGMLYFGSNQITSVAFGAFSNITGLSKLDLGHNLLSRLPENMFNITFSGSSSTLYLADNPITLITPGAFKSVRGLDRLILSNAYPMTISSGILEGLSSLQSLYIYSSVNVTIATNAFVNMIALQAIVMTVITNMTISTKAFSGLTQLQHVELTSNTNMIIESDAFIHVPLLQELYIDENRDLTLSTGAFQGLNSLPNSSFYCGKYEEQCSIFTCPDTCGPNNYCNVAGLWDPKSNITCLHPTTTTTTTTTTTSSTTTTTTNPNVVECSVTSDTSAICNNITYNIDELQTITSPMLTFQLDESTVFLFQVVNGGLPRVIAVGSQACVLENAGNAAALFSLATGSCEPLVSLDSNEEWTLLDRSVLNILFSDSTTNSTVAAIIQCVDSQFATVLSVAEQSRSDFTILIEHCSACSDGCGK